MELPFLREGRLYSLSRWILHPCLIAHGLTVVEAGIALDSDVVAVIVGVETVHVVVCHPTSTGKAGVVIPFWGELGSQQRKQQLDEQGEHKFWLLLRGCRG